MIIANTIKWSRSKNGLNVIDMRTHVRYGVMIVADILMERARKSNFRHNKGKGNGKTDINKIKTRERESMDISSSY